MRAQTFGLSCWRLGSVASRPYLSDDLSPLDMGKPIQNEPGHHGDQSALKLNLGVQTTTESWKPHTADVCAVCPSLLWMVCVSVTMNADAGINLYHEAVCQLFHVEFINYGASSFHKRLIWIHVWFVSALFLIWPLIHFQRRVQVLQIRFCFLKQWRKEINQLYVMQHMFPGPKVSDVWVFLTLFCVK